MTPTTSSPQPVLQLKKPTVSMNGQFAPSVDIYAGEGARPRSGSVLSANTRHSRSGSIVDRLSGKHHSPVIPSATSRTTDESHKKKKKGKKGKKERTRSVSSAVSGANSSIAAALAKSGLHIASPVDTDIQSSAHSTSRHSKRSPFLVRGKEADDDSYMRAEGDDEASRLDIHDYEDEDDDEDESDSDLDEHLPVTGFAVASNRRQHEFHGMFPAVDEGDYLIEGELTSMDNVMGGSRCRLRLCAVKGHLGTRSSIRFGESPVLPRKHLWLGDRCKSPKALKGWTIPDLIARGTIHRDPHYREENDGSGHSQCDRCSNRRRQGEFC